MSYKNTEIHFKETSKTIHEQNEKFNIEVKNQKKVPNILEMKNSMNEKDNAIENIRR